MEADMKSVWTIGKYVRMGSSDGSCSSVPPIRRLGSDTPMRQSEEKGKIFYETFFPAPPQAATHQLRGAYPEDALIY